MCVDADDATKLLSAASQCADRSMRLIYAAEARLLIDRERQRLREQEALLDALEADILRATAPEQMTMARRGAK
jgi:hypothetical protein